MTYNYVIGMDVGKYFHHACILDSNGNQFLSKHVNQHEQSLLNLLLHMLTKIQIRSS